MVAPLLAGAVQVTVAAASPATADTPVGAPGGCGTAGVTALEAGDDGPSPSALWAATSKVYAVPFVRPLTTAVDAGGEPARTLACWATPPTIGVIR